jgi:chromosome segregation ATPase
MGIKYQQVAAVLEKNSEITINELRAALGDTGSMTTIKKFRTAWFEQRQAKPKIVPVDEGTLAALNEWLRKNMDEEVAPLKEQLLEAEAQEAEQKKKIEEIVSEYHGMKRKAETLEKELTEERAKTNVLEGQLMASRDTITELSKRIASEDILSQLKTLVQSSKGPSKGSKGAKDPQGNLPL